MSRVWRARNLIRLALPADLYHHLIDDALASAGLEICGLLAGCGDVCSAAYPVKNVAPRPRTVFYMDPSEQVAAMRAMQRSGESMLGIYHSHPTSPAIPSAADVAGAAYPGLGYLIISVRNPRQPEIAAFILDEANFEAIPLEIVD